MEKELTGGLSACQRFTADLVPHRVDLHRVLGQSLEALQDHGAQGAIQQQLKIRRAVSTDYQLSEIYFQITMHSN